MSADRDEQESKVKVVDRRRFVMDTDGQVVERPDAPQREQAPAPEPSPTQASDPADVQQAPPTEPPAAPQSSEAPEAQEENKEVSEQEKAISAIFLDFINSLAHSVLVHIGEIPDPGSGIIRENLEAAQQTIEFLSVLRRKTDGNLSQQETHVFDSLIYELMMRFRQKAEGAVPPPAGGAS